jgi:hypothetical protein
MQFDLTSGTDWACHAVFDPAAMLHVINDREADPAAEDFWAEDVLDEDAERGNVLLHPTGTDGGILYRVFVGEEPDAEVLADAEDAGEFLLRAPGGTLFACGMEYLFRPDEEPIAARDFAEAVDPLGEGHEIGRGAYRVEVFEVLRPQKPRRTVDRVIGKTGCFGCLVTLFGTVAVALLTLAQLLFGDSVGRAWLYWPALVLGFWVLLVLGIWARRQFPDYRSYEAERRASEERSPFDAVLVLHRASRDAGSTDLHGGYIGAGDD